MNWRLLLALVLCNALWGMNPIMGKFLLQDFSPLQTAWLRYAASFVALALVLVVGELGSVAALRLAKPKSRHVQFWLCCLGLVTFFASPLLQYSGLSKAPASINALLVAFEPIFAVFLAWIVLHERLHMRQWIAFALSLCGFVLLNPNGFSTVGTEGSLVGSVLLLLVMPCEAFYTLASRILRTELSSINIFAFSLAWGFLLLSIVVGVKDGFPSLGHLHWHSLFGLLWLGPLSTCFGYIFWSLALKNAPIAPVVLTLLVQPLVGAVAGVAILHESLGLVQCLGGLVILGALLVQTDLRERNIHESEKL